jgi:glycine/D-amino acid oxidase-like deaminating enzyme
MNRNDSNEHRHAAVIGGSIAGLLAARVLSEHYEQVTLVERDALPVSREARRGVPQGGTARPIGEWPKRAGNAVSRHFQRTGRATTSIRKERNYAV